MPFLHEKIHTCFSKKILPRALKNIDKKIMSFYLGSISMMRIIIPVNTSLAESFKKAG